MTDLEVLEELASAGPEAWEQITVDLPRLLSAELHKRLVDMLATAEPARAERVRPVLEYLIARRTELEAHPDRYPVGSGPIEQLLGRVLGSQVTLEAAYELAKKPAVAKAVGVLYLQILDVLVERLLDGPRWHHATYLQCLVLAATESLPDVPAARRARERAVLRACTATQRALIEAPDKFLYTVTLGQTLRSCSIRQTCEVWPQAGR